MKRVQSGIYSVEFALVGAVFFMVLFGVIEVGRALWVWNTLSESTRRGARVAAVCPMYHGAAARTAVFGNPGDSDSPIVAGLSTANVLVQYLDENGAATATFEDVRFVRVGIQNFQHQMLIPFVNQLLNAPAFSTTLPSESLGVPREGAGAQCFGTAT